MKVNKATRRIFFFFFYQSDPKVNTMGMTFSNSKKKLTKTWLQIQSRREKKIFHGGKDGGAQVIRLIWKCRVNVTVHVASLDNFDFVVAMVRRDILIRFHAIHPHNVCRGPDHNRGETLLPCQFLSSILADWSRWHLCLLANYSFLFWKKRKNICFEMLRPSVSYNTHLFWCGRYNRRANEWSCRNDENISTRSPSFLGAMPYIQLIFPPQS